MRLRFQAGRKENLWSHDARERARTYIIGASYSDSETILRCVHVWSEWEPSACCENGTKRVSSDETTGR
jgi:hypothetical protein